MLVTRQLTAPIVFQIFFFPTMEVNGYHQLFDYQQSSTYQKKKDTLKILIS